MFLKVVLFCSQGLGRIYRQVKWKVYYSNKGNFMGLSNEILFILIFLAFSYLWIKTLDWNLPMRFNMSVSVVCTLKQNIGFYFKIFAQEQEQLSKNIISFHFKRLKFYVSTNAWKINIVFRAVGTFPTVTNDWNHAIMWSFLESWVWLPIYSCIW